MDVPVLVLRPRGQFSKSYNLAADEIHRVEQER
jgi:hypothetical protein